MQNVLRFQPRIPNVEIGYVGKAKKKLIAKMFPKEIIDFSKKK